MTRLLVTGCHGQLGRALLDEAAARELPADGCDLDTVDIADAAAVRTLLNDLRPTVVINCAAMTDVDGCETEPERADEVNGQAVGHLADSAKSVGALLVQVSTDYVFSGPSDRPWREEDPPAPMSAYGRSKLLGEELARRASEHLIVRTAWLFGHGGRNFVEAILRQLDSGARELRVVVDQSGCPTYAPDLASAILDLVKAGARGTVHAANDGATSWHGFASAIVELTDSQAVVRPVATREFPRPARRPEFSVLDTTLLRSLIGRGLPGWRDALERYLEIRCAS